MNSKPIWQYISRWSSEESQRFRLQIWASVAQETVTWYVNSIGAAAGKTPDYGHITLALNVHFERSFAVV